MGAPDRNVLVVCSTDNLMSALQRFEVCHNWEMDHCRDSFTALQRLKSSAFDMIIMDHNIEPLNPFKLMDYVFHELQKTYRMVIVGDGSEPEAEHENYLRFNYPIEQHNIDALVFGREEAISKKDGNLFSLEYLIELSDNNNDFLEESILLFKTTLDTRLKDLRNSIAAMDFEEARQIAHNIKPSFAMVGNDRGQSICHTICYDATEIEIPELTLVLVNEYELIINEIEKQFPKFKVI